jgi:autotransporter-associated beta strand protein
MHSSVDVLGGRMLGTALAAAILIDPANAAVKANARATALAYFESASGSGDLFAAAHSAGLDTDPYASRELNKRMIQPWWTYVLPRRGPSDVPMTVPEGAEVLLETRQPYLSADQRREVLRTTALPSGYSLLDGGELWGRLNLFAAADGYGAFDADVTVVMDAAAGGFSAADAWRNDIRGRGALAKQGTGTLTLTGDNSFSGGTVISEGTLVAASPEALGNGPVQVGAAGTLAVTPRPAGAVSPAARTEREGDGRDAATVRVDGTLEVAGTLAVTLGPGTADTVLSVAGGALLDGGSALVLTLPDGISRPAAISLLSARQVRGTFGTVSVTTPGYSAMARYARDGVTVLISAA